MSTSSDILMDTQIVITGSYYGGDLDCGVPPGFESIYAEDLMLSRIERDPVSGRGRVAWRSIFSGCNMLSPEIQRVLTNISELVDSDCANDALMDAHTSGDDSWKNDR